MKLCARMSNTVAIGKAIDFGTAASVGHLASSGAVTHLHHGNSACELGPTLPVPAPMQLVDNDTVSTVVISFFITPAAHVRILSS